MRTFDLALNLLFPADIYCASCGRYMDRPGPFGLCTRCLAEMEKAPCAGCNPEAMKAAGASCAACTGEGFSFDRALFCCAYDGRAGDLIRNMKYRRGSYLAGHVARMMAARFFETADPDTGELPAYDLLVPVPMHIIKKRKRGYDQTQLIGRELARLTGVPYVEALVRLMRTDVMSGLRKEARLLNLEGAFEVAPAVKAQGALTGKSVLLIDDVFTTGSTAETCAKTLREEGAVRIDFFAFAYA